MIVLWQDRNAKEGGSSAESLNFELLPLEDSKLDNQKTKIQNELDESKKSLMTGGKSKFWNKLRKTYVKKADPLKKKGAQIFTLIGVKNLLKQYKKT
jgi:hypothetical protein